MKNTLFSSPIIWQTDSCLHIYDKKKLKTTCILVYKTYKIKIKID